MSSKEDEKKELYEFNRDYLKTLNRIRAAFNLVAISDNEQGPSSASISPPPSTDKIPRLSKKFLRNDKEDLSSASISPKEVEEIPRLSKKFQQSGREELRSASSSLQRDIETDNQRLNKKFKQIDREDLSRAPSPKGADKIPWQSKKIQRNDKEYLSSASISPPSPKGIDKIPQSDREGLSSASISLPSPRRIERPFKKIKQRDSEEIEMQTFLLQTNSSKLIKSENVSYTPPKKKFRMKPDTPVDTEEEPSDQSSPIVEKTKIVEDAPDEYLCLPNVPRLFHHGKSQQIVPTVTIIKGIDEFATSESSDVEELKTDESTNDLKPQVNEEYSLTTGLDLPRKHSSSYNFPSVVHIANWVQDGAQEVHPDDELFSKRYKPDKGLTQKYRRQKLSEVETFQCLNNMTRFRDFNVKPACVEIPLDDDDVSDAEPKEENCCSCSCWSFCFTKKPRKFFS